MTKFSAVLRIQFVDPPVELSLASTYRIFTEISFQNGVHSALVRVNEELLERKVAAPV
jgi:hypothetical protein